MTDATTGSAFSGPSFPSAGWQSCDASEFPERPYPGRRPSGSWRLTPDGTVQGLQPSGRDWVDRLTDEVVSLAGRHLVLGYGSNVNPAKLASHHGAEQVLVLRTAVFDWAAAWCSRRRNAGDVVATLVEAPGHVEVHAVIAVTDAQRQKMDTIERHPDCYRRQTFAGTVLLENGETVSPEVYIGTPQWRPTLLIDGQPPLCSQYPYDAVDQLVPRAKQS
jgi:hypothetical protein